MKPIYKLATGAGMVVALAFAGSATTRAENQPGPAYLVVEVDVKDQNGFEEYAEKATKTVLQYGGTFLVGGATAQTIEGAEPNGNIVIIKFGSVGEAQNWLTSPEYSAVKGIRHRTADTRQYLVEGLPPE